METRLTLMPGQSGTRKLLATYGERLVCVRYRYDLARKVRHKTVELIVETTPWNPRSRIARRCRAAGASALRLISFAPSGPAGRRNMPGLM